MVLQAVTLQPSRPKWIEGPITVSLFPADGKSVEFGQYYTPEEAVADIRDWWQEDATGEQLFVLTDAYGVWLGSLWRAADDESAACTTRYPDGRQERHTCSYVFDEHGRYERTVVEPVYDDVPF